MGFIHLLILLKSYKNRFSQMIMKKRCKKILTKRKDFYRWSKIHTNKNKSVQIVGRASSIVNEVIRTISIFFYEKILSAQKRKSSKNQLTKQKQVNKKQQRLQFFGHKTSKRRNIVCFAFLKKNWNCLDNLIYYTTYIDTFYAKYLV